MPMSGNTYVAPTWVDNAPPAISASELQAMCNAIVNNQNGLASAISSLTSAINGRSQAEIVSYVGTGTFGVNNPCSVSASFPIKSIFVLGYVQSNLWYNNFGAVNSIPTEVLSDSYTQGYGIGSGPANTNYSKVSQDAKTFYWYNTGDSSQQCNISGVTYYILLNG